LNNPIDNIQETLAESRPTLDVLKQSNRRVYYYDFGAGFYVRVRLARVDNSYAKDPILVVIAVDDDNKLIFDNYFQTPLSNLYLKIMPWMHGPVRQEKKNLYSKFISLFKTTEQHV
jgi:hypothetical protein